MCAEYWKRNSLRLALAAASMCSSVSSMAQEVADKPADPVYLAEPEPGPEPTVAREGRDNASKYDNGQVRIDRQIRQLSDDQIVNHGEFIEYYRSGQKFAEGRFEDGIHQGAWKYWYDNGQLAKDVVFKNGQPDGSWDAFRADGTLLSKKNYKNGKREGAWVYYHDDGKTPRVEQSYKEGKLDGPMTTYHANGKVWQKVAFAAGAPTDVAEEFDPSGRKQIESHFKDGRLHGTRTRWNADGTVTVQEFADGKPAGRATTNLAPAEAPPGT